jgi:hypothetical protein
VETPGGRWHRGRWSVAARWRRIGVDETRSESPHEVLHSRDQGPWWSRRSVSVPCWRAKIAGRQVRGGGGSVEHDVGEDWRADKARRGGQKGRGSRGKFGLGIYTAEVTLEDVTLAESMGSWETEAAPRSWLSAMAGAWSSAALVDARSGMVVVWSTELSFLASPSGGKRSERCGGRCGRGVPQAWDDGLGPSEVGDVLRARSAVADGAAMGSALVAKDERGRCGGFRELGAAWRGAQSWWERWRVGRASGPWENLRYHCSRGAIRL